MGSFSIQFADPSKELTGGEALKPSWNPSSWGSITLSAEGCRISGTSRLSLAENFMSMGVFGQIFVKTFFESIRMRVFDFTIEEVVKIVGVAGDKTTKLTDGTVLTQDQVGIFLQKSDKNRDFISFSF